MIAKIERERDFGEFLKVLRRRGRPKYLPFYEHIASSGFVANFTQTAFDRMSRDDPGYWKIYVDFWMNMGYDCVPMEIPLNCPLPDEADAVTRGSESKVVIRNRDDFERYPWPDESRPIDFGYFEIVSGLLPDGVKIVGGVEAGPFEWASWMMGITGLSYALADDPELVEMVFEKIGSLHISAHRQVGTLDSIGALRQGDDLGYKTATFLRPELLRKYVFPIYTEMAAQAHSNGKPFILHSCGDLGEVYEDLIEDCKIDAKHSFEDIILGVAEFKKRYGGRITPLGGLDVDFLCCKSQEEIRDYTRRMITQCFSDGYWALGTGNSLTNYLPVENYLVVLEEGVRFGL